MNEWIAFLAWVALCAVLLRDLTWTPRSTTSPTAADVWVTALRSRSVHGIIERYPLVRFYRPPCARFTAHRWRSLEQHLRPLSVPSDIC
jgi:hypothetical protein